MKKILINSLIAASALTSLTSEANVTIVNNIKNLPVDYGSDPGIFNLTIASPFGSEPDIKAKQWNMEYTGDGSKEDATIYFAYLDNNQASQYAEPSQSCIHVNLTDGKTVSISIDNSDPQFPQTVCS